jgi:hypothetical protein
VKLSTWTYVADAFAIALISFGIGQIATGYGMIAVLLASTICVSYSMFRQKRSKRGS